MLPKKKMAEAPTNPNSQSSTMRRLPEDLITEILLHLPVKSLMKFKCVSKPWLSLISSPQFIKSHFRTSAREGQNFNPQLLFTTLDGNSGMKQCSLSSALLNTSTHFSNIEIPSHNPEKSLRVVGIVNGLVCLAVGKKDLYVWNPVLRKSKHFRSSKSSLNGRVYVDHGFWNDDSNDGYFSASGFGYDELNDDYKVVKMSWFYGNEGVNETQVTVYSLRGDSWRRTEDFKHWVPYNTGKYANGKLFWTAKQTLPSSQNKKIVCFDMANEMYEEVKGPDYEVGVYNLGIGVLNGCLYVLCDYYRTKADLWMMDKCGFDHEECWSKVISLPYEDVRPAKSLCTNPFLCISRNGEIVLEDTSLDLCISRNGKIVLQDKPGLLVYSSKDKKFRKIQLDGCGSYCEVFVYVESLVSPDDM